MTAKYANMILTMILSKYQKSKPYRGRKVGQIINIWLTLKHIDCRLLSTKQFIMILEIVLKIFFLRSVIFNTVKCYKLDLK